MRGTNLIPEGYVLTEFYCSWSTIEMRQYSIKTLILGVTITLFTTWGEGGEGHYSRIYCNISSIFKHISSGL